MGYQLWLSDSTGYRRKGTSFAEVHALLEAAIPVRAICEPLLSCRVGEPVHTVQSEMNRLEFDVVGVQDSAGEPIGYASQSELDAQTVTKYITFAPSSLIADSTGLVSLVAILANTPRLFVLTANRVQGIVTRADLNKPPVRATLFGLVSLLELHITYWVRRSFQGDQWVSHLSDARQRRLTEIHAQRLARGETVGLFECLQLSDKRTLIKASDSLRSCLRLGSRSNAERWLKEIEELRDRLAHSQESLIGESGWEGLATSIRRTQDLLAHSERALTGSANGAV